MSNQLEWLVSSFGASRILWGDAVWTAFGGILLPLYLYLLMGSRVRGCAFLHLFRLIGHCSLWFLLILGGSSGRSFRLTCPCYSIAFNWNRFGCFLYLLLLRLNRRVLLNRLSRGFCIRCLTPRFLTFLLINDLGRVVSTGISAFILFLLSLLKANRLCFIPSLRFDFEGFWGLRCRYLLNRVCLLRRFGLFYLCKRWVTIDV